MNVFWDWNGTLCDDVLLALEAVNSMLNRRGLATIGLAEYYRYMDTPIRRFYEHLFDLRKISMEEISAEFHAYYRAHLRDDCLMPGALETLRILQAAGVRQYLLSSSHRESILPTVERLGLLTYFSDVIAAEDWEALPKAKRARAYCVAHGLTGSDTWFIGDLLHDREVSAACGASCLLLPAGHQSEADLRRAGVCFCENLFMVPERLGVSSFAEKD